MIQQDQGSTWKTSNCHAHSSPFLSAVLSPSSRNGKWRCFSCCVPRALRDAKHDINSKSLIDYGRSSIPNDGVDDTAMSIHVHSLLNRLFSCMGLRFQIFLRSCFDNLSNIIKSPININLPSSTITKNNELKICLKAIWKRIVSQKPLNHKNISDHVS